MIKLLILLLKFTQNKKVDRMMKVFIELATGAFMAVTGERPTEVYCEDDTVKNVFRVRVDGIILVTSLDEVKSYTNNDLFELYKTGIEDWFQDPENENLILNGGE
jgi:hypothetical protein